MLRDLLKFHKVDVYTSTSVRRTTADGVIAVNDDREFEIKADTIIASVGYLSDNRLYQELKDMEKKKHQGSFRQKRPRKKS